MMRNVVFSGALLVLSNVALGDTLKLERGVVGEEKAGNHIWMKTKLAKTGTTICQPWKTAVCTQASPCTSCAVKYFSPTERAKRKLTWVESTNTWLAADGKPYDTATENAKYHVRSITKYDDSAAKKWNIIPGIWVLDTQGNFYTTVEHEPGVIHHSSFMAGGLVEGAGQVVFVNGKITHINNASGHYKPDEVSFRQAVGKLHIKDASIAEVIKGTFWSGGETKARRVIAHEPEQEHDEEVDLDGYLNSL